MYYVKSNLFGLKGHILPLKTIIKSNYLSIYLPFLQSLELKLMECTFTPRINKKELGQQEAGNANRFDQLFWDAENRRHRQAEYMQWHPEGLVEALCFFPRNDCFLYSEPSFAFNGEVAFNASPPLYYDLHNKLKDD